MPDGHWHLISGVPSGLNWRPTEFRHPVPTVRVCSLCGFSPRRVTLLPCSHAVCERCLEGCVGEDSECPLDREKFHAEDCHHIGLAVDKMMKLEVSCWNSVHGCRFVGPLSQLLEHFENECRFHEVSCRVCQARVLHTNVPRHLRHECGDSVGSGGSSGTAEHNSSLNTDAPRAASVPATSLTVADVNNALAELKEMLADSTSNQLAVFETKMNELAEKMASLAAEILTAVETKESKRTELPRRFQQLAHNDDSSDADISRESMSRRGPSNPEAESRRQDSATPRGADLCSRYIDDNFLVMPPVPPLSLRHPTASTSAQFPDNPQSLSGRGTTKKEATGKPAYFLIHSESQDIGRPSYNLTLSAWTSFKKKASNTQSYVYATSTVWNGRESWFRVLLAFDSFGGDATYLNAYVKFHNSVQGSSALPSSLAILHYTHNYRALKGQSKSSPVSRGAERDSNVTSQGYGLYLSAQVVHLEEGGYIADDKIRFRLVINDASR